MYSDRRAITQWPSCAYLRPLVCRAVAPCPLVTKVGSVWTLVPPTSAVDLLVTAVIAAEQAAKGPAFDLSSVVYPLACVVPPGEGSANRNEAVLYRDNQRSVGLPLSYSPPVITTAWVATAPLPDSMSPDDMCAATVDFGGPTPVTVITPPLVAHTAGTLVRLAGANFGARPVVFSGLSVDPARVCASNGSTLVFIVPAGQGSGGAGYRTYVRASDQTSEVGLPLCVCDGSLRRLLPTVACDGCLRWLLEIGTIARDSCRVNVNVNVNVIYFPGR